MCTVQFLDTWKIHVRKVDTTWNINLCFSFNIISTCLHNSSCLLFTSDSQMEFLVPNPNHHNFSFLSGGFHESEVGECASTVWFWTFSHKRGMVPSSQFLHEHLQCVAWGCLWCCIHVRILDTSAYMAVVDRPVGNCRLQTQALEVQARCISRVCSHYFYKYSYYLCFYVGVLHFLTSFTVIQKHLEHSTHIHKTNNRIPRIIMHITLTDYYYNSKHTRFNFHASTA